MRDVCDTGLTADMHTGSLSLPWLVIASLITLWQVHGRAGRTCPQGQAFEALMGKHKPKCNMYGRMVQRLQPAQKGSHDALVQL